MPTTLPNLSRPALADAPSDAPRPYPGHLLVMVCDAALRFVAAAEAGLAAGLRPVAVSNVRRAQSILVELLGAMDRAIVPEATDALSRVCQHLIDDLSEAIATGDAVLLSEVCRLLSGLRDAWVHTIRAAQRPGMPSCPFSSRRALVPAL